MWHIRILVSRGMMFNLLIVSVTCLHNYIIIMLTTCKAVHTFKIFLLIKDLAIILAFAYTYIHTYMHTYIHMYISVHTLYVYYIYMSI